MKGIIDKNDYGLNGLQNKTKGNDMT